VLNSKIFNYVGVLSYSIYLWQQPFIFKRPMWVTHFPQNLFLIFVCAMFSYYIIEKPFLKLKSRFSLGKRNKTSTQMRKVLLVDEKKSDGMPPSETESREESTLPST